jgi:type III secretion system FlhB-like substrate exporter
VSILEKVYQSAIALTGRGGRVIADARSEKAKKHNNHIYDDQTIENMLRYYKVEENFDTLLKYIKSRGLQEDVL